MISKELIENRINNFLGYGNIDSNIWFVCMEEGFAGELEDLKPRFKATKDSVVVDICDDMTDVPDHIRYFLGDRPPIQRTWSKLITMLLAFEEQSVTTEIVREYQITRFGRRDSNHCILDLMPLPSRSIREVDWIYSIFKIDYLMTRGVYFQEVMPMRIKLYQEYISKHRPTTVIFCSFMYLPHWIEIAKCQFEELAGFYYCKKEGVNYFVIPHPMAHGISNAEWIRMANEIKVLSKME